jgi:hypothetical protein
MNPLSQIVIVIVSSTVASLVVRTLDSVDIYYFSKKKFIRGAIAAPLLFLITLLCGCGSSQGCQMHLAQRRQRLGLLLLPPLEHYFGMECRRLHLVQPEVLLDVVLAPRRLRPLLDVVLLLLKLNLLQLPVHPCHMDDNTS